MSLREFLIVAGHAISANGEAPTIVFDNRPETGVPREARDQEPDPTIKVPRSFHALTNGTIKTVRIRYFDKDTWETEKEAGEYVAGFLSNTDSQLWASQMWSQGVLMPEIECIVEFTDEHRKKLAAEKKWCTEGRLLMWNTVSCYRDATGRWWFVGLHDHYHHSHPMGNRTLAKPALIK